MLVLAAVLASGAAQGQVAANGDEYSWRNHQPTAAEVRGREDRAGVTPPPSQQRRDNRNTEDLGRQLLHDEAVDPPRNPARPTPP